jgi:uncharacterized protein (TIGR01777 family)
MPVFERVTPLPGVSPERVWAWHASGAAFGRLVPPWEAPEIVQGPDRLEVGEEARFLQPLGPLRLRWTSRITRSEPGVGFVDEALRSPFRVWRHEHWFRAGEEGVLGDRVTWELPRGLPLQAWSAQKIAAMFAWRHRVTREDLALVHPRPLRVGVTGASGLVGRELSLLLRGTGHTVVPFVRGGAREGAIAWDPARGPHPDALRGLDAIVHLAGEPVAQRWSASVRERIRSSRVDATAALARAVAQSGVPVLICASAVGFYGHREELVDESSPAGTGVLADVGAAWEGAADAARAAGARVVHLRIGMVLSGRGGALPPLASVFRTGLGGPLGSGRQGAPWVALDDLISMMQVALFDPRWEGPINAVAPEPIEHGAFCEALAHVLRRPCLLRVPAAAVRLAMGEMGTELLLSGARVQATRLRELGYVWRRGGLEDALRVELGCPPIDAGG